MAVEQLTPDPAEHEAADAASDQSVVIEAALCVESVARKLVPPQLTAEKQTEVTQDPGAWDRLFARRRAIGLGTISNMATGFVRPHGRVERSKRG